jgi:3-mercaptopyruvate sulfurtransferase SseA
MRTRVNLSDIFIKSLVIILIGSAIGLTYNAVSPSGIALIGNWSPKITSDSLVVPYGYEEDIDPPAISLDYAMMKFQSRKIVFLDARLPEDFKAAYEESEEYAPQVLPKLAKEEEIIAYCDGTECESSLLLARELMELGYGNIKVFFGGWQEWQEAGLPVETGE